MLLEPRYIDEIGEEPQPIDGPNYPPRVRSPGVGSRRYVSNSTLNFGSQRPTKLPSLR